MQKQAAGIIKLQRYLDHNATCPPVSEAIAAWCAAAKEIPGNASSIHWAGRAARHIIDDARDCLAGFVGSDASSVVFTSGGTEANNLAIHGWLSRQEPGRILTSAIEHPSVLKPLQRFADAGWELVVVPPDENGVIEAGKLVEKLTENTRLVCLMAVNNETGAIQPVAEVGDICRERGIPLLVDAVQALGKTLVDLEAWGADFVSFSAHKIGGPKGVGALIVHKSRQLQEIAPGGGQERGRRSGTENVPGIAGFAAALGVNDFSALEPLRDSFENCLKERLPDVDIYAEKTERVGNTSMFSLPGFDGETLLMQLDLAGFAIASGSACSSGKRDPSHVLLAMGHSRETAGNSVRISFGPGNSLEDGYALIDELCAIRQRLLSMTGAI
ncbi:MAG: cysteine desulfurase family protein [Mariprofundaceae bacterium]